MYSFSLASLKLALTGPNLSLKQSDHEEQQGTDLGVSFNAFAWLKV